MSFYRVGYSNPATKKKKTSIKKKPIWDDTVHDLTAYKATDEEIKHRRTSHKSKNHMTYKLQQMRKVHKKEDNASSSQVTQNQARQLAIMKEILYDQRQLKNVLDKTDNMMAVVKDLFGDDPKKYKGFPNVTTAPNASGDANRTASSLAPDMPEIYTRTEALSDSVMNPTALNDLSDSDEEDTVNPHPIVYHPQMNLQRFQQFIANEEKNQTLSSIGGQAQLSHNEMGPTQSTQIQSNSGFETPPNEQNDSMEFLRPPSSAINDTNKVNKSKSRLESQRGPGDTTQTSSMNLTDMRKVLESLQDEIAEFEKQTGRKTPAEKQRSDTFSGYTVALVDAVSKLARYLRETDRRLQAEITVREQLTQDVHQMRTIIDALTSDIIVTQEEYVKSQGEFNAYKQKTDQEIAIIKAALHGMGGLQLNTAQDTACTTTPPKHQPELHFDSSYINSIPSQVPSSVPAVPNSNMEQLLSHQNTQGIRNILPIHRQDLGATLLSPPVRKTRVHDQHQHLEQQQNIELLHKQRQTSLMDLPSLSNGHPVPNSSNMSPSVATINVPRPISLAQCNVESKQEIVHSLPSYQSSQNHQPSQVSVSVVRNPVLSTGLPKQLREEGMQSQIAELNKQHEEAQKRLQLLLLQQKQQKILSKQDEAQRSMQHESDQMSQSMLNQQKELMQQQQEIALLLERQSLSFANQNNHNNNVDRSEVSQKDMLQQQEYVMKQMHLQMQRIQDQQQSMGFDIHRQQLSEQSVISPLKTENTQNGGPFSPQISPISQKSDSFYEALQNEYLSKQTSRGIKISLPTVDFDTSI